MSAPLVIPGIACDELEHSSVLEMPIAAARWGIMHHYDDSSRDDWSLKWFQDPACKNGYTWIVMDDGRIVELADPALRTPHAGKCLTASANSVFYGVCAATNGRVPVTAAQYDALVEIDVALFRYHHWPIFDVPKRIRGHHEERVWTSGDIGKDGKPVSKDLIGKLGAKMDPIGIDPKKPVLDLAKLRIEVRRRLEERIA